VGRAVAADDSGSIYLTGFFADTVDFDPGPGIDEHAANSVLKDVFLSRFDSSGQFQWARTWGGPKEDVGQAVALDDSGNVYVTGNFSNTADFDPGAGIDEHTSCGFTDVFLSRFDSFGEFQWARTWGGTASDSGWGVAVAGSDSVYITGYFQDTEDFDPGPAIDEHASNGHEDVFLSKFDSFGEFQWVRAWGGKNHDWGWGVAVDGSGDACVTGSFMNTVDFDPGTGIDEHAANGNDDVFLSKFDSSGEFQWARTWGGKYGDIGWDVTIDGLENAYVTGAFFSTVDFDPGSDIDYHTWLDYASFGIFLSKFLPDGTW
jgi:hypothetical protein